MRGEVEPAAPSNSSKDESKADGGDGKEDGADDASMFTSHKVSKLDTLAGLAIKYNVTVSDIKRANGLLSDQAMFARDTLLIPKKTLPLDEESAFKVAQMVSSHARGVSNFASGSRARPGSNAFGGSGLPGCEDSGRYAELVGKRTDFPGSPTMPFCAPSSIELQTRAPPPAAPPRYAGDKKGPDSNERLNRRRKDKEGPGADSATASSGYDGDYASGDPGPSSMPIAGVPPPRPSLFSSSSASPGTTIKGFFSTKNGPSSTGSGTGGAASTISGAVESMLAKIKRAASTPALAPGGPGTSLRDVGEALASTLGSSGPPPPRPQLGRTSVTPPATKVASAKQD